MLEDLEKELRKWRQTRASKPQREARPNDRHTLKVNGQEVLVVRKKRKLRTEREEEM